MTLKYTTLLFFASFVYIAQGYYYWQDYYGDIPPNAIAAGSTNDGKNVYIGQAYVKSCGIVVVEITPGAKEFYATIGGVHKVDKYIKILCGEQEDFYWLETNSTQLHSQGINETAVIGGHEDTYGYMNIGRTTYSGSTKVGKVNSFWPEKAYFYYNADGHENRLDSYEILLYNQTDMLNSVQKE